MESKKGSDAEPTEKKGTAGDIPSDSRNRSKTPEALSSTEREKSASTRGDSETETVETKTQTIDDLDGLDNKHGDFVAPETFVKKEPGTVAEPATGSSIDVRRVDDATESNPST
jgi:hypothetical protein